ncbi:MAG: hypothetical protein ACW981_11590 [Candidatus Hodarchaeales archaeon]
MKANSTSLLSDLEIYDLFLLFQSLDDIKRSLLMVLCHIHPKEVSTSQLADLAGYSTKSKYIFKSGALDLMEKEGLIEINKPTKRLSLIKINSNHDLLYKFAELCQNQGKQLNETFLGRLLEYE